MDLKTPSQIFWNMTYRLIEHKIGDCLVERIEIKSHLSHKQNNHYLDLAHNSKYPLFKIVMHLIYNNGIHAIELFRQAY